MINMDTALFTYLIIAVTVGISLLAFQQEKIMRDWMHYPYWENRSGEYYRLLTSGFLHGDFMHLAFNMYALYGFGGLVESWFEVNVPGGRYFYLLYYVLAIVLANLPTFQKNKDNPNFRSIGASGAVSAVVFSAILIMPQLELMIMFIPIPIKGWIFGILYLAYSSYASKNNNDAIDHEAHFWGAVFGFALPLVLQPALFSRFIGQIIG
jgi:membrane associated rhomboid family serine protease